MLHEDLPFKASNEQEMGKRSYLEKIKRKMETFHLELFFKLLLRVK